ncbi:MAG: uroporphyrinogen decarboxylase [Bacteroidetes bacterium]|nr:uroporphyrinogen decarboxylase [Bacteroidota bacterium]
MNFSYAEIIGYIASFTVLISFLMKNIKTLRIINTIGCSFFVAYGILLNNSIPIIFTNTAIIGINVYYLSKLKKKLD